MLQAFHVQTSLRAYLLTLGADTTPLNAPVAKTGAVTLGAVADGYTRAAGSFLADRFTKGMEVTPAGFSSSARRQIVGVTATKIKVEPATVPVQAAAAGRSLIVGVPATRAWEDIQFDPVAGVTWIEEQFAEGPRWQSSVGEGGDLTLRPTLNVFVHVPSNSGLAARLYADAVLRLFPAGADIPLLAPTTPADYLKVRVDEAPTSFELIPSRFDGFSTIPVSIPMFARTINII
jgi:hypothetical protein